MNTLILPKKKEVCRSFACRCIVASYATPRSLHGIAHHAARSSPGPGEGVTCAPVAAAILSILRDKTAGKKLDLFCQAIYLTECLSCSLHVQMPYIKPNLGIKINSVGKWKYMKRAVYFIFFDRRKEFAKTSASIAENTSPT